MKKVIIGVLLFCVCSMSAQDVRMLKEDHFWEYSLYSYFIGEVEPDPPLPTTVTESFYRFVLGETEVINGKTYHKLYWGKPSDPDCRTADLHGNGFHFMQASIREEAGRVLVDYEIYKAFLEYMWYDILTGRADYIPYKITDDGEMILYDFNMQVGDKYNSVLGHDDVSVVKIEKITTNDGIERKFFILSNGLKIIEGIGCINSSGMFLNYLNPVIDRKDGPYWLNGSYLSVFRWFDEYDNPIYSRTLEEVITGSVGIVPVTMDKEDNISTPLYDLLGREVIGIPEPGIYIRNRKKIWVK